MERSASGKWRSLRLKGLDGEFLDFGQRSMFGRLHEPAGAEKLRPCFEAGRRSGDKVSALRRLKLPADAERLRPRFEEGRPSGDKISDPLLSRLKLPADAERPRPRLRRSGDKVSPPLLALTMEGTCEKPS
mmetsp:Transcript_5546/g.8661  ORF Transcript_5546/g.8661 Transcript_5546/m.8661 type:complete len:131 (-) Transcript_5546:1488-1880(-)